MFNWARKSMKRTVVCLVVMLSLIFTGFSAWAMVIVMDNKDTQIEEDWTGGTPFSENLANEMKQVAENDNFILYYNPASLAVQVVEKATGYIHSSIVEEGDEVEGMNSTWRGMMQSGITLELLDAKGNAKTWPLTTKDASVEVKEKEDGFTAHVVWPEGIAVTMKVTLTEDGIDVSIPESGTTEKEGSKYTLLSIYVFPFMDANRGHEQNGYLFVPDGSGALIRTSVETISAEPYEKQIYGSDIGLGNYTSKNDQGMLLDPENIYVPVYGVIQNVNESGVAVIIEDGDEYANIQAYASGITTEFNFITSKFLVRQSYQMKVSQSGETVSMIQEERNHFDINVVYKFLSGDDADYVGIAESYREHLIKKGALSLQKADSKDIPLKLEFIVAEKKEGLFGKSTVSMTSAEELDIILTDLMNAGVRNIQVVLRGVGNGGASGAAPTLFTFEKETGSKKEWAALIEKYDKLGVDVALYCDFTRGYDDADGYSNRDRAQSISKVLLQTFDNGRFTYLSPAFTVNALTQFAKDAATIGVDNLAVDAIGKNLYSNWNSQGPLTRGEAKNVLESVDTEDTQLSLYTPNAYMFSVTDAAYDLPTSSSGYYIFTDTVPFLQIVLKGCVDIYGTGFNFHANADADMLRCIEYGLYPSYYLTKESTIEMIDTPSGWLYTSEYDQWRESIISEYGKMNAVMEGIKGATITERTVLSDGVIMVEYSNGKNIVVNYNDTAFVDGDVKVEAKGCLLIEDRD